MLKCNCLSLKQYLVLNYTEMHVILLLTNCKLIKIKAGTYSSPVYQTVIIVILIDLFIIYTSFALIAQLITHPDSMSIF